MGDSKTLDPEKIVALASSLVHRQRKGLKNCNQTLASENLCKKKTVKAAHHHPHWSRDVMTSASKLHGSGTKVQRACPKHEPRAGGGLRGSGIRGS